MSALTYDAYNSLEEERDALRAENTNLRTSFGIFAKLVFTEAIAGLADAAIVANQEFNEVHALREVQTLANHAKKLRAENERLTLAIREAMNELGVPHNGGNVSDGYPAPVSNAYKILNDTVVKDVKNG